MTIQQCKYVLEISKTASFNEAAKHLFIAQSSLSASIKALEQELDIKIFDRSQNGVYLTHDGAEFVRYASQIAEHSDFILERYNSHETVQKLNIVTQHYDFVADIFGKMIDEAPDDSYKFALRETRTHDVIREIESSYSDIGIIAIKAGDSEIINRYLRKKGITFTSFLKVSPHVFLRKAHPLAGSAVLTYSDLKDYPYISYEQGVHNVSFFTEELIDEKQYKKHIEISDRASLMNVLLLTDGYTIGTGIMPSALNRGNIVSIPLNTDSFYSIGYILLDNRKQTQLTEKFIQLLVDFSSDFFKS